MKTLSIDASKLHSFADIITNSSTEVFIYSSRSTIEKIKDLVNALFAVANYSYQFDNLFTAKLYIPDIEYEIEEKLEDEELEKDTPEYEARYNQLLEDTYNEDFGPDEPYSWGSYRESEYGIRRQVEISLKEELTEERYTHAVNLLNQISSIFTYEAVYS